MKISRKNNTHYHLIALNQNIISFLITYMLEKLWSRLLPPELPLLHATLEFRRRLRHTSKPHRPSTYSQFINWIPPFRVQKFRRNESPPSSESSGGSLCWARHLRTDPHVQMTSMAPGPGISQDPHPSSETEARQIPDLISVLSLGGNSQLEETNFLSKNLGEAY